MILFIYGLSSKNIEEQGEDNAYDDAGGEREIETAMLLFYEDIPWKSPYPGELIPYGY